MMAMLGFSVGPAFGGYLAQTHGLQAPFVVCSMGMLSASVFAAMLPETRRKGQVVSKESPFQQWAKFIQRPPLQGITAVSMCNGIVQGASPVTVVLYASETLGMSPAELGLMFTAQVVTMAAATPLLSKMSDGLSNRLAVLLPSVLLGSFALVGQSACTTMNEFVGLGVVGSLGSAGIMTNMSAFVMDHTKTEERAQALAMRSMSSDLGVLVGACSMGVVSTYMGIPFAMQTAACVQGAAAVFCALRTGSQKKGPK